MIEATKSFPKARTWAVLAAAALLLAGCNVTPEQDAAAIERDILAKHPDKTQPLYLYCGGGYRSALAADALRQMGYERAVSVDGGWRALREIMPTE